MKVSEIMDADPVVVGPEERIETVLATLEDNELSGVPVVSDGGRLLGIITEADLVLSSEEGDLHLPHYVQLFGGLVFLEPLKHFEDRLRKATAARARDMMTPNPVTIEAGADVRAAARLIAEKKHNRIPVVEHGQLVGIVTRLDVIEALSRD